MQEVSVKTHLIVKDIHEEYSILWTGRFIDAKPLFVNDLPVFIIISGSSRVELNTGDQKRIEDCAKAITRPKGRAAVTVDHANIYLKEEDGNEKLMGIVTHKRVKTYAPMYDKVGYR